MVENYAPLTSLRTLPRPRFGSRAPSPPGELAWHAADDRAPGVALRRLWLRHVARRLRDGAARLARRVSAVFSRRTGPGGHAPALVPGQSTRERAATDA